MNIIFNVSSSFVHIVTKESRFEIEVVQSSIITDPIDQFDIVEQEPDGYSY